MTIKNKIRFGIGFLFLVTLISSGMADYYLTRLSNDSKAILKDNYRSLQYVKNISEALDNGSKNSLQVISNNITNEELNITEPGERKLADSLRLAFNKYRQINGDGLLTDRPAKTIRQILYHITQLNMRAIELRNATAATTAHDAIILVSFIGTLCFLVAFSFMINFPGYVADPVIKNISAFEQLNQDKTTFIATISHELKTPLSSIKMSLQLLEDVRVGSINTEQKQLLENIDAETQRLLKITAELLDAAQVEAGKIKLNFGNTHPQNIVNYAVKAIWSTAEQKGVEITVNCPDHLPNVKADADKATWVLINLLSNAVKYSPANAAVVLDVQKHKSKIIFSVTDTGDGIDKKYQDRIFDRYFRVPQVDADKAGTGLGLAIAKDFIEAQGGSIGVESQTGKGSRFYFDLNVQ